MESVFSINGRQKLSSLARKVKKTIDRMQTGTTKDVAKCILGDDSAREMSKKGRHQIRKIKRRIYDVLNVLEAVDDITKNEKTVRKTERLDCKPYLTQKKRQTNSSWTLFEGSGGNSRRRGMQSKSKARS